MSHTTAETKIQSSVKVVASPAKIIQNIVTKKLSGRLTIGDPSDSSVFWRVYFGNGQVHFATSTIGQQERLRYFIQWYYPELISATSGSFQSDYEVICDCWQAGKISLPQVRKLLFWLSQEALVQVLALPQGTVQFEKTLWLDPLVLSVSLKELVLPVRAFVNQWIRLRPEINSPFQRPFIKDLEQLSKLARQQVQDIGFIKSLIQVLNQNLNIYEAAYHLKTDTLGLASLLQTLVKSGAVGMNYYMVTQSDRRVVIACIDDSKTTQRNVKMVLEASGYKVLAIPDATRALTTLARHKPALILMDINMPEINGYELCKMLRQSTLLKDIPIVMLTGRDGIVDKLRARMVGASDYITKPFKPQQLLSAIRENLHAEEKKLTANTSA
ncbi:MAG: response regulator [Oscillatoriaceae bacterium SKW80]|nr:response regulator [Oscillatoriaceae bacterium SKYG93]MCX8121420.1 response regulator [Oscillatoriaceae bacterium SKW80]MDW8451903.1 response regulator [Oscillatoriaceae cyanobacterium SKYGB_i_bin93]HIK29446.1 response regulator [Oscillatoriaceae cyanobacterium M7585_C2015_266]